MKSEDCCIKFVKGETKGKASNIFIEDNTLYSYGHHFALGYRLIDGNSFKFILNKSKYSRTTSKQQNYLKRNINDSDVLGYLNTKEMYNLILENPKSVKEMVLDKLEIKENE